jgi:hypothetical protein
MPSTQQRRRMWRVEYRWDGMVVGQSIFTNHAMAQYVPIILISNRACLATLPNQSNPFQACIVRACMQRSAQRERHSRRNPCSRRLVFLWGADVVCVRACAMQMQMQGVWLRALWGA